MLLLFDFLRFAQLSHACYYWSDDPWLLTLFRDDRLVLAFFLATPVSMDVASSHARNSTSRW